MKWNVLKQSKGNSINSISQQWELKSN